MAETPSTMLPLDTQAADFCLFDTCSQTLKSLKELESDIATVIMFICNHCPYVKYIHPRLMEVTNFYLKKGIQFIAINSNDVRYYLEDSPENMRQMAQKNNYQFPYLYDETQEIAKAYHAACTPDFYIFDKDLKCVYRGRFDNTTPGNGLKPTGEDLCKALDQILAGQPVFTDQKPSVGCNIKWKKN